MAKMNAYKYHEARMTVQNIVIPAIGLIGCVVAIPENRQKAKEIYEGLKVRVKESKLYKAVFDK